MIASALALDPMLGEIDNAISAMPDGDERASVIKALGEIMRLQLEAFILPICRQYPDLEAAHGPRLFDNDV